MSLPLIRETPWFDLGRGRSHSRIYAYGRYSPTIVFKARGEASFTRRGSKEGRKRGSPTFEQEEENEPAWSRSQRDIWLCLFWGKRYIAIVRGRGGFVPQPDLPGEEGKNGIPGRVNGQRGEKFSNQIDPTFS